MLPDRLASPPEAIYASDLQRARHTAQPLADAFGLPLQIEPGLREYDLGAWEGRTFRDLNKNERLYQRLDVNPDFAPPEGESPRQVVTRFLEVAHRVSALHSGRVILVSHGGAISMSLGYLLWGEHASLKHLMDNCAVTELSLSPPTLHQFNEVWGLPTE
ncbi:MAG: putative phosphoglycerate mutase [Myxococcota bacterium]